MANDTKGTTGGDLLIWHSSDTYNFVTATIKNPVGGTAVADADMVGQPVDDVSGTWTIMQEGDTSTNIGGIIIEGPIISALAANTATTEKYKILVRGPATINNNSLPTADHAGVTFTNTVLATGIDALSPTIVRATEPTKTSTGVDETDKL